MGFSNTTRARKYDGWTSLICLNTTNKTDSFYQIKWYHQELHLLGLHHRGFQDMLIRNQEDQNEMMFGLSVLASHPNSYWIFFFLFLFVDVLNMIALAICWDVCSKCDASSVFLSMYPFELWIKSFLCRSKKRKSCISYNGEIIRWRCRSLCKFWTFQWVQP